MKEDLNKWEKLFIDYLQLTDFKLVANNGSFSLIDLLGCNFCNIESDKFEYAYDVLVRLTPYEYDHIISNIEYELEKQGIQYDYDYNQPQSLLQYRSLLKNYQYWFDYIEMIYYHPDDINLSKIYNKLYA